MIRRIVLPLVIALGAAGTLGAASPTGNPLADPFVAGNTAAATGDHATAAAAFERALATRGWSPGTLFDLGNAYAGSGHRGLAILAYERGLVLAPRDSAIANNLARTREAAGVSAPPPSRIRSALGRLSTDEWTWFALAGAALACAAAAGFAWFPRRRGRMASLVALGVAASGLGFAAAIVVAPPRDVAVVISPATARIAPLAAAEEAFPAPEGETLQIEQQRGDFVYVRDGDRSGWVPRAAVERVVPDRAPAHT